MEELKIVEHDGVRVVTTKQLAEMYGADVKKVSYDFNHNKNRYQDGKHYFVLSGNELRAFRENHELPSNLNKLYLWTEKGALLIAKSINTDTAWEAYERLVDFYFENKALVAQANQPPTLPKSSKGFDWLETSKTKLPLNRNWFDRNRRIIKEVADETGLLLAEVEQEIVDRVFQRYDKSLCSENFITECGRKPRSKKEMISYFEELGKEADKILYDLQELPF